MHLFTYLDLLLRHLHIHIHTLTHTRTHRSLLILFVFIQSMVLRTSRLMKSILKQLNTNLCQLVY